MQEAADVADQCTKIDGTVAAGWKLLGDIEVHLFCAGKITAYNPTHPIMPITEFRIGVKPIMSTLSFMPSVSHAFIESIEHVSFDDYKDSPA